MLELNKRTVVAVNGTGPRLGRYRFRVQELEVEGGKEYFVSYKEGWFGDRKWVIAQNATNRPFYDSESSNGAALPSLEEAMRALEWARTEVEQYLKVIRASNERKRLRTIVEDR